MKAGSFHYQKTVLENGMTVISDTLDSFRSVSLGIMVGTGSAYEDQAKAGISHFIEHMVFKGTPKRTAFEIARALDSVGGKMNAYTSKEVTCFYAMVLDTHFDLALDVLSDMFLNSLYDPKEMELEKNVIGEEIRMYEDDPDDLIHDLFSNAILGGHPLGRSTLGTPQSVGAVTREEILAYLQNLYTPDNVIIAVSGNIEHKELVQKVETIFGKLGGHRQKPTLPPAKIHSVITSRPKKVEQVHLCLGTQGVSVHNEDRYIFSVLDNILGGSMSSRLFQEIREKRGLAYSVSSYDASYKDFGVFAVSAGTGKKTYTQVVDLTLQELTRLKKEGITPEELSRAKEYHKGTMVLGLESTSARMGWIARSEFYYQRLIPVEEVFQKIDRVGLEDIVRIANTYFDSRYLTLAAIGDFQDGEVIYQKLVC